jgi:PAS domain S-box-containing protein
MCANKQEQMTRPQLLAAIKKLDERCRELARLELLRADLDTYRHQLESQELQLREAQLQLEASRDAYADLYDFAPVPYFTLDRNGLVKEANLTACTLLAIDRARLIGMPLYSFVADSDRPAFLEHLRRCRKGTLQLASELQFKTRDGQTVPVQMNSRVAAGEPDKVRTVLTDLTDRRKAEWEIRNLNAELEQRVRDRTTELVRANEGLRLEIVQRQAAEAALQQADRLKDEFLAMLGHELRNPLGPLEQAIEVWQMSEQSDEDGLTKLRSIARRQVRHIAQLVDELLDVSRISRGKILLHKSPLDLTALVREVTDDFAAAFREAGVALELDLGTAPIWIDADATRLAQILGNLLHNASKFTPPGGHVTVGLFLDPSQMAILCVRDTGIGIAPENISRIFTTFYQSDHSLDRALGGLGLGLALVKALVDLHGGQVLVHSEGANRGTEFTVRLPTCAAPTSVAGQRAPAPAARRHRVLVIDDQRDALFTMHALLERLGQDVVTAENGPEALKAAAQFRPDIVFSDIGLPEMDGYAIAKRMRSDPSLRPGKLVAVTGYGQAADQKRAYEAGFDAHLTKPVALEALCRILNEMPPTQKSEPAHSAAST